MLVNIKDNYPIMNQLPSRLTEEQYNSLSEYGKVSYSFYRNSHNKELVEKMKSRLTKEELFDLTR